MYLGVSRLAEHVFEIYFGVPRHIDIQEAIFSQIIVCSVILAVPGGFFETVSKLASVLSTFSRTISVYGDTLMSRR